MSRARLALARAGTTTARQAAEAWFGARATTAEHPRHLVLVGLVTGLLLGPRVAAPGVLLAAGVVLGAGFLAHTPAGLLAAIAVLGGGLGAQARADALEHGPLLGLRGSTVTVRVVPVEAPRQRAWGGWSGRVALLDGPAAGETAVIRARADSGWPARVGVGEAVEVRGQVAALNRGEAYQRARGASSALVATEASATGRQRGGLAGAVDGVRRRAEATLDRGLAPREAGLARGMVLGQDEGLDETARDEFRASGLSHLVAASGQNVLLLAMGATLLLGALGVGLRTRLLVALVLVVLYVPLAGGGPSIQRAGIMGAAGLVAALAGRASSRYYAVGLAAAVTLLINPRACEDPGWQLSFAAVIALLALAPGLRDALTRRGTPSALAEATAVTLAATLGTAPLLVVHFEAISLTSLPANVAVTAAVAPVMWLGMLMAAVGQVAPGVAALGGPLLAPLLGFVEWVAHVAAAPTWASVEVRSPPVAPAVAGLLALAVGTATARMGWRHARGGVRQRIALGLVATTGAGLALLQAAHRPLALAPGELMMSFLDVGQGDATLLQRDGTSALIDTGPPGGPVIAELRRAGVSRLDLLVISHAQSDHEGMAAAVVRAFRPRVVLDGGGGPRVAGRQALAAVVRASGGRVRVPSAGQRIRLGAVRLDILWPPKSDGAAPVGDPNDRAVVALARMGEFGALLTADAESDVTAALDVPRIDALKVAHHGSDDPGLPAQLARLRPRVAAIEVGARNPYGHPTRSTLAALRVVPEVVRTDRDGTVRLRVRNGRMRLEGVDGRPDRAPP